MKEITKDTTIKLSREDHAIARDLAKKDQRKIKTVVSIALNEYKNKTIKGRKK